MNKGGMYLLLILFSCPLWLIGQLVNLPAAEVAGLVNATVANSTIWSNTNNPGALAQIKQPVVGLSCLNNYFLPELQHQLGAVVLPTQKGTIGLVHQQYGNQTFRLSSSGLAYAMQLNPNVHAGVQVNYDQFNLGNFYGRSGFVTAQLGLFARLTSNVMFGASVSNIGVTKLNKLPNDYLNTTIRLGLQVEVNRALRCYAQAEQELYRGFDLKGAMEYTINKQFKFKSGVGLISHQLGFGVGYNLKQCTINVSSQYIAKLGLVPAISLHYEFKKRGEN
jgi:hypothetical protein